MSGLSGDGSLVGIVCFVGLGVGVTPGSFFRRAGHPGAGV
jgi:hypothetical protein